MNEFKVGDVVYFYAEKSEISPFGKLTKGEIVQILLDFNEKAYLIKTLNEEYRHILASGEVLTCDSLEYDRAVEAKKIKDQMMILQKKLNALAGV